MAEGRPSSLQGEGNAGTNRRRRSPNLGIATLALDALGNVLGIDALGSSISPAEAALALFATRKILYHSINMVFLFYIQICTFIFMLKLLYPQTHFTNR